jgi:predicted peptidase
VTLTVYDSVAPGVWAHNAWKATYTNPELYTWFLQHRANGG